MGSSVKTHHWRALLNTSCYFRQDSFFSLKPQFAPKRLVGRNDLWPLSSFVSTYDGDTVKYIKMTSAASVIHVQHYDFIPILSALFYWWKVAEEVKTDICHFWFMQHDQASTNTVYHILCNMNHSFHAFVSVSGFTITPAGSLRCFHSSHIKYGTLIIARPHGARSSPQSAEKTLVWNVLHLSAVSETRWAEQRRCYWRQEGSTTTNRKMSFTKVMDEMFAQKVTHRQTNKNTIFSERRRAAKLNGSWKCCDKWWQTT